MPSSASKILDSYLETAKGILEDAGRRGKAGLEDIEQFVDELRPEVEAATDLAIRSGGQQTHLRTLRAQANAVFARTMGHFDTFASTSQRDLRVALTSALITGVMVAV